MEHLEGSNSSLIQSLRSVFFASPADPIGILIENTSESKIIVKFEMDSKSYTGHKQWSDNVLTVHHISCDGSGRHFNLCDADQYQLWIHLFLATYDQWPVADVSGNRIQDFMERYQFFMSLIFPGINLDDLLQKTWLHDLYSLSCYDTIEQRVQELQLSASAKLTELKATRQGADSEQKNFVRFEQELKGIDQEITRIETSMTQFLKQAEGDESELRQAEKINDFILTKKNEVEKIDFELRSYASLLKNNIAGEFTEDEILEIDKKSRMYEKILKREESLNQKVIERSHLEKNLSGILNEISRFSIIPGSVGTQVDTGRIDAFKDEVMRIKGALKTYEGIEKELDSLKKEKYLYQPSYDKFHVINKIKQTVSRHEEKKFRLIVEKLEEDRVKLEQELEHMRSSVHEDRYLVLFNKVQQKRQQILEYRKRLDELYSSRLEILRAYEEVKREMLDLSALEGQIRKQIHQKKYLLITGEAARFMQIELLRKRRAEFHEKLKELAVSIPDVYIPLAEMLVYEDGSSRKDMIAERYSYSEIEEFIQIFRAVSMKYATTIGTIIIDEDSNRKLDGSLTRRIDNLLEPMKFNQILAFKNI